MATYYGVCFTPREEDKLTFQEAPYSVKVWAFVTEPEMKEIDPNEISVEMERIERNRWDKLLKKMKTLTQS